MKTKTIELPEHAIRYLQKMCEEERLRLAHHDLVGPTLAELAAFDSLNAIECSLPVTSD